MFDAWGSQLKDVTCTQKCIKEIKRTVEAGKNATTRIAIARAALSAVCRSSNVQAGIELFPYFSEIIKNDKNGVFVKSLAYFLQDLIAKNYMTEATSLLPIIQNCDINQKSIKDLFEIQLRSVVTLIAFKKLSESHFKQCTNDLLQIIYAAKEFQDDSFTEFMPRLLGDHNFRIVLKQRLLGYEDFLSKINSLYAFYPIKNIEAFTKDLLANFVFLISLNSQNIHIFALPYLKVCITAIKNAKEFETEKAEEKNAVVKVLTLLYLFLKLFVNPESIRTHFQETANKLADHLRCDQKIKWWLIDSSSAVTCYILSMYLETIVSNLVDEPTVKSFTELALVLANNTFLANNIGDNQLNVFCSECNRESIHALWIVSRVLSSVIWKQIAFTLDCSEIEPILLKILTKAIHEKNNNNECSRLLTPIRNAYRSFCQATRQSTNSKRPSVYLKPMLALWKSLNDKRNFVEEGHLISMYKEVLKLSENHKEALEMSCISIIHLLNKPPAEQTNLLREIAACCLLYANAKVDVQLSICDILDSSKVPFKVPLYDRKLVLRLQLEASIKYAGIDEKMRLSLATKIIDKVQDELELAELISLLDKARCPGVKAKIEKFTNKTRRSMARNEKDPLKMLARGRLLLRKYLYMLEVTKSETKTEPINENILHELDFTELKKFNVKSENNFRSVLDEVLENFIAFRSKLDIELISKCDWNSIFDDMALVARHFLLRGYPEHAYQIWKLIHKLTNRIEGRIYRIRAVSFFAEYSHSFRDFDIETLVNEISNDLLNYFKDLNNMTPRNQNYIILAIINISLHYMRRGNEEKANILVEMARLASKQLKRNETADLIALKLIAFNFFALQMKNKGLVAMSPFLFIDQLTETFSSIKYVTSEDTINMPIFMFCTFIELTYSAVHRVCVASLKPILYSLLQYVQSFALGLRMAQIVTLLTAIDLQMERIGNSTKKLTILDALLDKCQPTASSVEYFQEKTKRPLFLEPPPSSQPMDVRQAPLSPKFLQLKPCLTVNTEESCDYFLSHEESCGCPLCLNVEFKILSFQVGCLQGRNNFFHGYNMQSVVTFKQAVNWWIENLKLSTLEYLHFDSIFLMLVYYSNSLRSLNMHSETLEILTEMQKLSKRVNRQNDQMYTHILVEGLLSVEDESLSLTRTEKTQNEQTNDGIAVNRPLFMGNGRQHCKSTDKENSEESNIISDLMSDWSIDVKDDDFIAKEGTSKESKSTRSKANTKNRKDTFKKPTESKKTAREVKPTLRKKKGEVNNNENILRSIDKNDNVQLSNASRSDVIDLTGQSHSPKSCEINEKKSESETATVQSKTGISISSNKIKLETKTRHQPLTVNKCKKSSTATKAHENVPIESKDVPRGKLKVQKEEAIGGSSTSGCMRKTRSTRSKTPRF